MWEKEYSKKNFYWGIKPTPILVKFLPKIPKGKALDIGAGEGRNSIFLAKNGFKVEAIEKTKEGLEKITKSAKSNNLSIKTWFGDIKDFNFEKNSYSLIISSASIDFLKKVKLKLL